VAKFIIEVISDRNNYGEFNFVGDQLKIHDMAVIIHKVKGDTVELLSSGSFDDLKNLIKETKQKGNILESSYLEYILASFDGRGQLDHIDNDKFPQVQATSFETFLRAHPEALKIYNVE